MAQFPPTPEQSAVINFQGKSLVVKAFAGSGKTTTLVGYAHANPNSRILYLAYNRAIRDEAHGKFPRNTECKTSHQLAYATYGAKYRHKLKHNLNLREIADELEINNWSVTKDIQQTLNTFMCSADREILDVHCEKAQTDKQLTTKQLDYIARIIDAAKYLWGQMIDPGSTFPIVHDGLFKVIPVKQP